MFGELLRRLGWPKPKPEPLEPMQRVEDILRRHRIAMKVGACGCCMSPWIEVWYRGEKIARGDGSGIDTGDVPGTIP